MLIYAGVLAGIWNTNPRSGRAESPLIRRIVYQAVSRMRRAERTSRTLIHWGSPVPGPLPHHQAGQE